MSPIVRLVCQKLGRPLSEMPYAQLVSDEVREQVEQITLTPAQIHHFGTQQYRLYFCLGRCREWPAPFSQG